MPPVWWAVQTEQFMLFQIRLKGPGPRNILWAVTVHHTPTPSRLELGSFNAEKLQWYRLCASPCVSVLVHTSVCSSILAHAWASVRQLRLKAHAVQNTSNWSAVAVYSARAVLWKLSAHRVCVLWNSSCLMLILSNAETSLAPCWHYWLIPYAAQAHFQYSL